MPQSISVHLKSEEPKDCLQEKKCIFRKKEKKKQGKYVPQCQAEVKDQSLIHDLINSLADEYEDGVWKCRLYCQRNTLPPSLLKHIAD